jgi:hypothetical protein
MTRNILALSLPALLMLGSAASAQTPPAPSPGPVAKPAAPQPAPTAPGAPNGNAAANGPAQNGMAQNTPPEGMVIETPNGFYLVRPGQGAPRRLDINPAGQQPSSTAQNQDDAANGGSQQDNGPMDDVAADDQPPAPTQGHKPMHPPRPEGKGARFRIRTPNLNIGVKCPDDEPIKACVDAVSQLIDKAGTPAH